MRPSLHHHIILKRLGQQRSSCCHRPISSIAAAGANHWRRLARSSSSSCQGHVYLLPLQGSSSLGRHLSSQSQTFANAQPNAVVEFSKDRSEYENWVRRLYMTNMFNPVKLGLENIERLHTLLGNPMDDPNVTVIHIAGTNGKGSVALKIGKTLELTGLRVGLFCSPHISSFRERMQVNSQLITEQQVVDYLPHIYKLCQDNDIPATFFEITTALAFYYYEQQSVDVVVLETGLGGRLDSTNVVKVPACAVITSIGLEHTRILGDTIEKIALEKGGIIKEGRPVLVGPHVPHSVLQQCALDRKASGYYQCDDLLGRDNTTSTSPKNQTQSQQSAAAAQQEAEEIQDYDLENARIAAAAIRLVEREQRFPKLTSPISEPIIQEGTSQRPPCRFEVVNNRTDGVRVILDVAHNPPAMQYLMQKLISTYPQAKFRLVVGMSSDKDSNLCGQYILRGCNNDANQIHLVQAAHPRAARLEDILQKDTSRLLQHSHYDLEDRSVTRQIQLALELIVLAAQQRGEEKEEEQEEEEILVVCGSVFLMAEAREALGFDEPRDSEYIAEVAGAHLKAAQENFQQQPKPKSQSEQQPQQQQR